MNAPRDIVIVGGSLAGLRAAETLRKEGFAGTLTVIGEEDRLPYNRPPLSKGVLTDADGHVDHIELPRSEGLDARWLLGGRAVGLDRAAREVHVQDGTSVPYDGLVIATGARPRSLPGLTNGLDGVHVLRTLDDGLALRAALDTRPRRVAVLGAGLIGSEVAGAVRTLGIDVTLIDSSPLPLVAALGEPVARWIARTHASAGVDVRFGTGIRTVEGRDGRVARLRLTDGSEVEADLLLLALGVEPNTGWLESSGLPLDGGVVTTAALFAEGTTDVVAAGDVARWPNPLYEGRPARVEHWGNAVEQGRHAAVSLLRGPGEAEGFGPLPSFWSHVHGGKLQILGLPDLADEARLVHGSEEKGRFVYAYARQGRLVGAVAVGSARQLLKYKPALTDRAPIDTLAAV
ncbi:NAD(P)/FAD-dependent oxidoreductase [Nocardiopsis sp. NPDC055879]